MLNPNIKVIYWKHISYYIICKCGSTFRMYLLSFLLWKRNSVISVTYYTTYRIFPFFRSQRCFSVNLRVFSQLFRSFFKEVCCLNLKPEGVFFLVSFSNKSLFFSRCTERSASYCFIWLNVSPKGLSIFIFGKHR